MSKRKQPEEDGRLAYETLPSGCYITPGTIVQHLHWILENNKEYPDGGMFAGEIEIKFIFGIRTVTIEVPIQYCDAFLQTMIGGDPKLIHPDCIHASKQRISFDELAGSDPVDCLRFTFRSDLPSPSKISRCSCS